MWRFHIAEMFIFVFEATYLTRFQIEELYSNLTKKNAEIYVERGKAIRDKVSIFNKLDAEI